MRVFSRLNDQKIVLARERNADESDDVDSKNAENLDQQHCEKCSAAERAEPGRFEEGEQTVAVGKGAEEGEQEGEDHQENNVVGRESLAAETESVEIILKIEF